MKEYLVVRDTREKEGFGFIFKPNERPKKHPPVCTGTKIIKLDTGDYTVDGLEDVLCIERKDDFCELWANFCGAKQNFLEELERMSKHKYAFLLIESNLSPEVFQLTPPQFTTGMPGKAFLSWLFTECIKHNVNIIPAGKSGKQTCQMIMESVIKLIK